jgi:hypothetical protein
LEVVDWTAGLGSPIYDLQSRISNAGLSDFKFSRYRERSMPPVGKNFPPMYFEAHPPALYLWRR